MNSIIDKLVLFSFLHNLSFNDSTKVIKKILAKYHTELTPLNENESYLFLLSKIIDKIDLNINKSLQEFKDQVQEHLSFNTEKIDFDLWYEFNKKTSVGERKTFLLSQFLGLPDEVISNLQKTSEGSVRYRVSEAYHKFTQVIKYVQDFK